MACSSLDWRNVPMQYQIDIEKGYAHLRWANDFCSREDRERIVGVVVSDESFGEPTGCVSVKILAGW